MTYSRQDVLNVLNLTETEFNRDCLLLFGNLTAQESLDTFDLCRLSGFVLLKRLGYEADLAHIILKAFNYEIFETPDDILQIVDNRYVFYHGEGVFDLTSFKFVNKDPSYIPFISIAICLGSVLERLRKP